jgi:MFS family permease
MGVIFLTIFIDLVGFSVIFPLFPAMLQFYLQREGREGVLGAFLKAVESAFGASSEVQVAVLFGGALGSLYSLLQFVFAPIWGSLSDRVGRRPVLLLTIGGISISYLLWFFSGSFTLLVVSRLLGGLMGGNISVATAAVADSTTPANRARGMGIIGAAFGLGFILGPTIGGLLHHFVKIPASQSAFGVNPFSGVAAAAFCLSTWNFLWVKTRFRETLRPEDRGKANEAKRPINPLRLFRPAEFPGVNLANAIWFVYLIAFSGMEFTLAFLATERFQYTPKENGYMFAFSGLIIAFVQGGMIRQLAPLYGEKKLAVAGLAAVIPGFILTGLAGKQGMLYLGLGLMAFGSALVTPSLSSLVSLYAPSDRQGSVLGVFRSLGSLARAVGPLVACVIYWRFDSRAPYLAGGAVLLMPLFLSVFLPVPEKKSLPGAGSPD